MALIHAPVRPRPSLSMLGWALNEEESIGPYIERAEALLRPLTDDFELILIDDGSTDATAARIQAYQAGRPWLRVRRNERTRGSGFNTKTAIALAEKDYLFWQTVDWAYDLSRLGDRLPLLGHADVLQGVRRTGWSLEGIVRRRSDTPGKGVVSMANFLLIRALFGLPVQDYQNVTVYPTRLIQSVRLESESAFTNPECLLKLWWKGAVIQEFPVPFRKRETGTGKGTRPGVVLRTVAEIVYFWIRWIVCGRRTDRSSGQVLRWEERAGASQ